MIEEPFAAGTSAVHNLDPRFRIVAALGLSVTIALCNTFAVLGAGLGLALLLVGLAQLPFKLVFRRTASVMGFLLLIWLVLPFTFEGDPIYRLGMLSVSRQGVVFSARITLKSFAILQVLMALVTTMTIATLGHALRRLLVPGKLIQLLLMTYRYLFVIEQEYKRLSTAMRIRGFQPGTSLRAYKNYAYLIGMLFVKASLRAQRVQNAMLCRGFRGRFYTLSDYKPTGWNWCFLLLTAGSIATMIATEIILNGF